MFVVIIQKSNGDLKFAGEFSVNNIFKHHSEVKVGLSKKGVVFSNIFTNIPEDSRIIRLSGACSEKLDAGEP